MFDAKYSRTINPSQTKFFTKVESHIVISTPSLPTKWDIEWLDNKLTTSQKCIEKGHNDAAYLRSAPLLMQTIFGALKLSQTKCWFMVGSHMEVILINNILIE